MTNKALSNKTFWIGWIAVFVVMQAYGYVIHEIGLSETYQSLASVFRPREQMDSMMWMMMVAGVFSMLLFCYIFTMGYEGRGIMEVGSTPTSPKTKTTDAYRTHPAVPARRV